MVVTREETLQESDGKDQLQHEVGKVKVGDRVRIQYQGWYVASGKKTEFEDMYHSEKKTTFMVGGKETDFPDGVFRGIDEAVQQCVLGEKVRFTMTAESGFGSQEHRGSIDVVLAGCDQLVIELSILAISRDGTIHNRKQPADTSGFITKLFYCCFRAY